MTKNDCPHWWPSFRCFRRLVDALAQRGVHIIRVIKMMQGACVLDCGPAVCKVYPQKPVDMLRMMELCTNKPLPTDTAVTVILNNFAVPHVGYIVISKKVSMLEDGHPRHPDIFQKLCSLVNYIHDLGIRHRDIHVGNISYDGRTVGLIDFDASKWSTRCKHDDISMMTMNTILSR